MGHAVGPILKAALGIQNIGYNANTIASPTYNLCMKVLPTLELVIAAVLLHPCVYAKKP